MRLARHLLIFVAATAAVGATPASAVTVLDFEGVGNQAGVDDFYNGGTDSLGNSGTDFGISFSSGSLGLIDSDAGGSGNIANEPSGETVLFFLTGSAATMNVAAGFDTGFSFFFSSAQPGGFVSVFDDLNGAGNLLATQSLGVQANENCLGDPNGFYCNFDTIGLAFNGTAKSVSFGGVANFIVFDDITFGSVNPGISGVPEPGTWAMMLLGFFGIGTMMRRRNRNVTTKVSYS